MEYAPIVFAILIAAAVIAMLALIICIRVEPMKMIDISKVDKRAKRDNIT